MRQKLSIQITALQRGYLIEFEGQHLHELGDRYAALAPADLKEVITQEVETRINQMLDRMLGQ